jgi:hypothetical protein
MNTLQPQQEVVTDILWQQSLSEKSLLFIVCPPWLDDSDGEYDKEPVFYSNLAG